MRRKPQLVLAERIINSSARRRRALRRVDWDQNDATFVLVVVTQLRLRYRPYEDRANRGGWTGH